MLTSQSPSPIPIPPARHIIISVGEQLLFAQGHVWQVRLLLAARDSDSESDSDSDSDSDSQVVVPVSTRHLTSNDVQKEQEQEQELGQELGEKLATTELAKPSASERIYLFSSHFYCQQFSNDYKSLISNGLAFAQQTHRQSRTVGLCQRESIGLWDKRLDTHTHTHRNRVDTHTMGTRGIGARLLFCL